MSLSKDRLLSLNKSNITHFPFSVGLANLPILSTAIAVESLKVRFKSKYALDLTRVHIS